MVCRSLFYALASAHGCLFRLVVAHAVIAFAKSELLFFIFGRVADAAHSTTNARRLKNLFADDRADSLSIFLLTNQRVNVGDRGDSFALHFEQCRCNGIGGEPVKLVCQGSMIAALDFLRGSETDNKNPPDSPAKTLSLTPFPAFCQS